MPPLPLARPAEPTPRACLLSNGRYTVLLTAAGTGFSRSNGTVLTSWRGDRIEDTDGFFVYVRDLASGQLWSAGRQPAGARPGRYSVTSHPGRMCITRADGDIETRIDVCVDPDHEVEIRRLTLRNGARQSYRLELTSYVEVALHDPAAYAAHPAFAKLFVETARLPNSSVLLAHRRPRSAGEQFPWTLHAIADGDATAYETDRARFIGRGHTLARPHALASPVPPPGKAGSVLDPILSLRRVLELAPGAQAQCTFLLAAAPSRDAALSRLDAYRDPAAIDLVFDRAAAREQALRRRFGLDDGCADSFDTLAAAMLYGHPALRAAPRILRRARGSLKTLAKYGLDAAVPLAIVDLEDYEALALLRQMLTAVAYWQAKGLPVQLLALTGRHVGVRQARRVIAEARLPEGIDVIPLALRRRAAVPAADADVLHAAAHLVVSEALPSLQTHDPLPVTRAPHAHPDDTFAPLAEDEALRFDNGYGGFSADGAEYVIRLDPAALHPQPPLPWINVIANETFGCLVGESGAGYTWSRNSRENRLTPWSNDPILDPHGEAFYVRDDVSGAYWSALPGPVVTPAAVEVRHGFGYTRWRHARGGLEHDVVQFVARHDPLKITRLRLANLGAQPRQLSLFSYQRLVLGVLPTTSARLVVTDIDAAMKAVLAHNALNDEFSDAVVFAAAAPPDGQAPVHCSADRSTFIGHCGTVAAPAALQQPTLDGAAGVGHAPCAALQVLLTIPAGATVECAFLFGEARDAAQVRELVTRYRAASAIDDALAAVRAFWTQTLSALHVQTPSPALDLLLNGWLLYQVLSCRLWGRSAFYQSGGAFGFRDQLQDAAALIYTRPDWLRAQLLLHAAHQFVEGDVLHWWHPPTGRGIRTRFSDDLLWLPYLTAFYVRTTGDWQILDVPVGFVSDRPLAPGEDEAYLFPRPAEETADLYAHCCRALDRSLTRGAHGLPLMGTGDWNDGMNRVGREGRGESVWVGFFLYRILDDFVPLCERRGEQARSARYRAYQAALRTALNDAGWDGDWYRRAYYDDGTPLGSVQNAECRIDALAQAWAVLSGAAPAPRAAQAMHAVEAQLVAPDAGLIRLLTPPFDHDAPDPGYIKGYVPGIRENGGQYTHAAVWVVQAFATLGWRERATAALDMLSPIRHAATAEQVGVYQVEPYAVAADIYAVAPHVGRGGWTWYTGSAGWMYRVAVESLLGLELVGGTELRLKPCIPDTWPEFRLQLRLPDMTRYAIHVRNPSGNAAAVQAAMVNGAPIPVIAGAARLALASDGATHMVEVTLGAA